jgi:hypothetical protein
MERPACPQEGCKGHGYAQWHDDDDGRQYARFACNVCRRAWMSRRASKREAHAKLQGQIESYLAMGGTITGLPMTGRKYVFGQAAAKHSEVLRKRAARGKRYDGILGNIIAGRIFLQLTTKDEAQGKSKCDAEEELAWLRQRALPKPYVPIEELAHHPHSIRSNTPWDFEDRFLGKLDLSRTQDDCAITWGDTFFEIYDHDDMGIISELPQGPEGYKQSATVHRLVLPDYVQSLDRLFGREVDDKRLNADSHRDCRTAKELRQVWKHYKVAWREILSELRKEDAALRKHWHELLVRPSSP